MLDRRNFLRAALASTAVCGLDSLAFAAPATDRRLVLILLRGGLDGLAMVPAVGDSQYRSARGSAALETAEDLDGTFALHPAMAPLLGMWRQGELAFVHAAGLPAGARSHFDAQDMLDNGTLTAQGTRTGWLNRATQALDPSWGAPMALSRQVPLILRGPERIQAADPLRTVETDRVFLAEVERMYASDPALASALTTGLETRAMIDRYRSGKPGRRTLSPESAETIGRLLAADEGPRIGVLELGGWDTHVRQGPTLERRLGEVSEGLLGLQRGLGRAWQSTVVLAVSEFGRAVSGNGTGGTDHGTGGAVLLAGGAVRGGRVHADWPGLRERDLFEQRDLRVTTDVRGVFKGVLEDHLGVSRKLLETTVFPDSRAIRPVPGLV